tara:strand:+ start:45692 stop:46054 length:363 start_codon:yes stop_codon:yes gene_type:complete
MTDWKAQAEALAGALRFALDNMTPASGSPTTGTIAEQSGERALAAFRAAQEAQEPDDGWIPWAGGECPVEPDALVNVQIRAEPHPPFREPLTRAKGWFWGRSSEDLPGDITAYRLHKEPR